MRDRYRIRMNGNGAYRVQRRGWVLWHDWYDGNPGYAQGWLVGWNEVGAVYSTSEAACAALLRAQDHDANQRRAGQWSTVVKE